jgi:hypothetical protein
MKMEGIMSFFANIPFPVQFSIALVGVLALIVVAAWATRTRFGRSKRPHGVMIARLEGARYSPILSTPQIFLALGFVAMVIELILESSAIRLAAYGAIWTGWNVLCGIGLLSERRTDYIVYREISPERREPTL